MSVPFEDDKNRYSAEFAQLAQEYGIANRGGAHNGVIDAYRHAYVSGRFTDEYGSAIARIVGDGHELTHPNSKQEHAMDYHNNAVGRAVAGETPGNNPRELFEALMRNENRLILNIQDVPRDRYSSLEQGSGNTQLASADPQQAAIKNLQDQGLSVHQSTNGQGFVVSSGGEFGRNAAVNDIAQFADPNKAQQFAQNMSPQVEQQQQEQTRARGMA